MLYTLLLDAYNALINEASAANAWASVKFELIIIFLTSSPAA
ncbi:hypothetical protein CIRMBP1316_02089 [Enterococcus cecorum]|nr:hypothetical protein CIRMBP1316_02089 [Enterococcus cecorum]